MKEGKAFLKSKMKWVGIVGLIRSAFSLFVHILLARFTEYGFSEYHSSITIFSWRPIFETSGLSRTSSLHRRLWGPVELESLHPDANPRQFCAGPNAQTNGYIFVRIQGGFHEIRSSISDVVAVSRFLNATLVVQEIQQTTSKKGISSRVLHTFTMRINSWQISKVVNIVKTLPKSLKSTRRNKETPVFRVSYLASPYYYLQNVLPILIKHSVVELLVSDGGCLQAILPSHLEEYQRLRCRVSFHALRFREDVQELATKILRSFPKDVHSELIQHRRTWMIKRRIVKGQLSVNSVKQSLKGSCPLTPEEVGILLRVYGYTRDAVIYVSGGEVFGGQRTLILLHGMFENVVDRTSLSTVWELSRIYGREANLDENYPRAPPVVQVEMKLDAWKNAGPRPRPRPLPPPPSRFKTYHIEGWWGWVSESDNEPESTVVELRINAHKLLWEAIDYMVSVEADVFIAGYDHDGKGHSNFASLVMGHRLYRSASSKTFRPDRIASQLLISRTERSMNRDPNAYRYKWSNGSKNFQEHLEHFVSEQKGRPLYPICLEDLGKKSSSFWKKSVATIRRHLRSSLVDGLVEASNKSKSSSFLSHLIPECSCLRPDSGETSSNASSPSVCLQVQAALGVVHRCSAWMDGERSSSSREKENEEVIDENEPSSSGLFFQYTESHDVGTWK